MNAVDELQEAFNACLAIPTEDLRSSAEQNIIRFIEAARKLEVFFLQKQLLLSDSGESCDEINKLRAKLKARDNLVAKYKQKLVEWKKIIEIVGTYVSVLRSSDFYQKEFKVRLNQCISKLAPQRRVKRIICYGLGSFCEGIDKASRFQLALLILIVEHLKELDSSLDLVIEAFDPSFDQRDKEALLSFVSPKFKLIETNEHCARKIMKNQNGCCLFYMPHLDKYLYNNLLGANWTSDGLSRLIVLGNSFCEMVDNEPLSKCKQELYYMKQLVLNFKESSIVIDKRKKQTDIISESTSEDAALIEVEINDSLFEHHNIFNSMAFHFINADWLDAKEILIQHSKLPNWTCTTSSPIDESWDD